MLLLLKQIAISSAALFGASAAAMFQSPPPADPEALFVQTCLEGRSAFSKNSLVKTKFAKLPTAARLIVGSAERHNETFPSFGRRLLERQVPNTVYAWTPRLQTFLMPPLSAPITGTNTSLECAVIWKGVGFEKAQAAIEPWLILPNTRPAALAPGTNIGWTTQYTKGHAITVMSMNGWTMLRSMPKSAERKKVPSR